MKKLNQVSVEERQMRFVFAGKVQKFDSTLFKHYRDKSKIELFELVDEIQCIHWICKTLVDMVLTCEIKIEKINNYAIYELVKKIYEEWNEQGCSNFSDLPEVINDVLDII